MTGNLLKAAQKQVNAELFSAYLYLSMSSWAEYEGFSGMANWMRVQAQEEQVHALTLHDQLLMMGEHSLLEQVETPKQVWTSPLEMFEDALEHEKKITGMINRLATLAMEEHDHAFYQFIQMYAKEQVEEEASATEILRRLRLIKDTPALLIMLDKELGTRVFTPPFPEYTA